MSMVLLSSDLVRCLGDEYILRLLSRCQQIMTRRFEAPLCIPHLQNRLSKTPNVGLDAKPANAAEPLGRAPPALI
jgi:hypothetical protein